MEKIWLQSYPKGIPAEIDIDHIPSLVALFDKACKTYADKVAYISMGREITYRQLDAEASEFAGWLQAKGMQKGPCCADDAQYPAVPGRLVRYPAGWLRGGQLQPALHAA